MKAERRVYSSGQNFYEENKELVKSVFPSFKEEMLDEDIFPAELEIYCDYDFIKFVLGKCENNYYILCYADTEDNCDGWFEVLTLQTDFLNLAVVEGSKK